MTREGNNGTVPTSPREDRSEDRQKGKHSPASVGKGRGWDSGGTCQDGRGMSIFSSDLTRLRMREKPASECSVGVQVRSGQVRIPKKY